MFYVIIRDYDKSLICKMRFKQKHLDRDLFKLVCNEVYLNTIPVYDNLFDITTGGVTAYIYKDNKWVCNIESLYIKGVHPFIPHTTDLYVNTGNCKKVRSIYEF